MPVREGCGGTSVYQIILAAMSLVSASFHVHATGDYAYDWALVDVETSGLIARRDRVLSVAVITIGPDGEQTGEFSTLLDPECDPGPVDVHGLNVERLQGAPTFDQVAGWIGAMLQDPILVAHNAATCMTASTRLVSAQAVMGRGLRAIHEGREETHPRWSR
jgi:DNA polymerase III epsilon subunit-like protein